MQLASSPISPEPTPRELRNPQDPVNLDNSDTLIIPHFVQDRMPRTNEHGSRLVTTCTECKQAKLRCDSKSKYPDSCSRCHTRGLICMVDASFRRIPARQRLSELTKELYELRSQHLQDTTPSSVTIEVPRGSYGSATVYTELQDDLSFSEASVSLGTVSVRATIVMETYQTFTELFRPQFPIIGSLSIDFLYRSQPLLFWTIVVVVICRLPDPTSTTLFQELRDPYRRMLHEQIFVAPLPLHKVQLLLLLCQWPLPVEKQPHDPSWLYSGLAIHAARIMSLGRHETVSYFQSLGVAPEGVANRINTWLGCFYTSTSLALQLGLPSSIEYELDLPAINSFLQRQTVPLDFSLQVKIMLVATKYTPLIRQSPGDGSTASIMRLLETDLDTIKSEATLEANQSKSVELACLDVRLHLYALVVIHGSSQHPSDRQILLRKGLDAALRIIQLSSRGVASGTLQNLEHLNLVRIQRCLPKGNFRSLAFATIFLLKFSHLIPSQNADEKQLFTSHIKMAQDLFKVCSLEPLDEYARTAKLLEVLETDAPRQSQPLCLTHRMGYSIVLDAIKKGAEARGRPVAVQDDEAVDESPHLVRNEAVWDSNSPQSVADEMITSFQADWSSDFSWGFWGDPFLGTSLPYQDGSGTGQ